MTNYEHWCNLTSQIGAPKCYLDFTWLWGISAALQRRVWLGGEHKPVFPNQYIMLVGDSGIGKGIAMSPMTDLLSYHKQGDRAVNDALAADGKDVPQVLCSGPNSVTYESLCDTLAKSVDRVTYKKADGNSGIYTHSSMYVTLTEASSLFQRERKNLTDFLVDAWDCIDYRYETKTQGKHRIKRTCLSFIAGTTPDFMDSTYDVKLFGEGISARIIFVHAEKNRFQKLFFPPLSKEQEESREVLRAWIKSLTELHGAVTLSSDALAYLTKWWEASNVVNNPSHKLKHYYAKKNLHVLKMSMAVHFSRSLAMELTLQDCEEAMQYLNLAEVTMHRALGTGDKNPLNDATKRFLQMADEAVKRGKPGITDREALLELYYIIPNAEQGYRDMLNFLRTTGQIEEAPLNGIQYYKIYKPK